jgi:hypothetical protein
MSISGIVSGISAPSVSFQALRNKVTQGANPISGAQQAYSDVVQLTHAQTPSVTSTTTSSGGTTFLRSLVQFGLNFLK